MLSDNAQRFEWLYRVRSKLKHLNICVNFTSACFIVHSRILVSLPPEQERGDVVKETVISGKKISALLYCSVNFIWVKQELILKERLKYEDWTRATFNQTVKLNMYVLWRVILIKPQRRPLSLLGQHNRLSLLNVHAIKLL